MVIYTTDAELREIFDLDNNPYVPEPSIDDCSDDFVDPFQFQKGHTITKGVPKSEEHKRKLSVSLKEKGIKPKYYIRTEKHRQDVSDQQSKRWTVANPRWLRKMVLRDQYGTRVLTVADFYLQYPDVNYGNLSAWSRQYGRKNRQLHKKSNLCIDSYV